MTIEILGSVLLGGLGWTLLEYLLHRFVFHERLLGPGPARPHLKHHAKVDWFMPARTKAGLATGVMATIVVIAVASPWAASFAAFGCGLISGWLGYEWLHRRIHVAAPFGAYGRWARRHHLAHHFGHAGKNHGVTSPIWDLVFGTYRAASTVRIPRLHASKFPWLLEGEGRERRIRDAWATTYSVI